MTKENRERAYLHFRDLEKNYNAIDHLNKGITATQRMRKEAKKNADEILERDLKRPLVEVDGKPSRSIIICGEPEKPKEEVKGNVTDNDKGYDKKETKSTGKK